MLLFLFLDWRLKESQCVVPYHLKMCRAKATNCEKQPKVVKITELLPLA